MSNRIKDRFTDDATTIQSRLQEAFEADVDLRQGSLVGDLTRGNAQEFEYAYIMLNQALKMGILNPDMPSDILSLKAQEYGITRYSAKGATGEVVFTGEEGRSVPKGTIVRTSREPVVEFETTFTAVTDSGGTATVGIKGIAGTGSESNVPIGWVNTVVGDLSGVLDVTNNKATTGGYDEQSDEDLYEQVINKIQRPITSGNAYHYEKWATDVEGIRRAKVFPLWDGNGTVKVVLLGGNGMAPTEEKVKETADYIETQRPIGATVTVEGADELAVNIDAKLVITKGADLESIKREYSETLQMIFADTAFRTDIVRYSRLAALLLDMEGVLDWEELTVNGGTSNIQLDAGQIAVVGEVTFSEST